MASGDALTTRSAGQCSDGAQHPTFAGARGTDPEATRLRNGRRVRPFPPQKRWVKTVVIRSKQSVCTPKCC